jgi:hypothetical protein
MMEKDPLESSRVGALDMLKGTKVETTNCFKTVAEYIENNIIEIIDIGAKNNQSEFKRVA